ncbi:hypothetical protein [Phaeobacter sp. C3_T13_0]|uniref:hypothetical protein n=1 Tax=Phaeobacter cretensis TaxID=3342641 RepID=UPI0039BCFEF3
MAATATFSINMYSAPTARAFSPCEIESRMDSEAGVKARVFKDSAYLTIQVPAAFSVDTANWLSAEGLI